MNASALTRLLPIISLAVFAALPAAQPANACVCCWPGYPAVEDRQAKRQIIALQQLPDLLHKVRDLEKKVKELGG